MPVPTAVVGRCRFGGGDRDFNDNVFLFEGVSVDIPVPPSTLVSEPASLSLLGLLLGGLWWRRRAGVNQ